MADVRFFDLPPQPRLTWSVGIGLTGHVARVNLKYERTLGGGPAMRRLFRALLDLARRTQLDGRPAVEDPAMRQRLAEIECYVRCVETMSMRQLSASARGEGAKVALPTLIQELYNTDSREGIYRAAYDLLGNGALLVPRPEDMKTMMGADTNTGWVGRYLFGLAGPIAAGSSNIQRNLIAERGLGLPRDPRPGG